ncbi:protein transport protein sec61 subunit beta [Quercus suber]|uniref:Protein transport protein sec61 subunit beta n=1 Tax=Quercus suber TaxID=58331 RepID=A0AAW0KFB8_QUESU
MNFFSDLIQMALGGTAPPRGSAAATASMRRRRTTSGGASGGPAGTMLQFYTDDAPGLKISPNVVLVMSIGFIAFVAILHVMGILLEPHGNVPSTDHVYQLKH